MVEIVETVQVVQREEEGGKRWRAGQRIEKHCFRACRVRLINHQPKVQYPLRSPEAEDVRCPFLHEKARSLSSRRDGDRIRDFLLSDRSEADLDQDFLNSLGVEGRETRHTATSIC